MAHDNARAVPKPVLEPAAQDVALPAPRPPVLEPMARDITLPAPPPSVVERTAHDSVRPAPRPVHGSRAGWILSIFVAAAAAWAAGWVAGVSWAWRAVTPRYLRRTHRPPV
jgi:hypothetical protein